MKISFENNLLETKIEEISLSCGGNISFSMEPDLFSGNGFAIFNLSKLNLTISTGFIKTEENLMNVKIVKSKIDISKNSFNMHFYSDDEIFDIINSIQETIFEILLSWIQGEMSETNRKYIENGINRVLNDTSNFPIIEGTDILLDYHLIAEPNSPANYLPISLNGTAICNNPQKCKKSTYKAELPPTIEIFDNTNNNMQILISEYLLNTIMIAGYENSLFNYDITPEKFNEITKIKLDTNFISVFIPEVLNKYGENRDVFIRINAENPLNFTITAKSGVQNTNKFIAEFWINSTQNLVKSFVLEIIFNTSFDINAYNNLLKSNITNTTFSLNLVESEIKEISLTNLVTLIQTLLKLFIPQINNFLNDGIRIPSIGKFFSFSKSKLFIIDKYIKIYINPEPVSEFFSLFRNKFNNF